MVKKTLPHYVCIAWCGDESDMPRKCTTPGCRRNRNPLTKCQCQNEKHTRLQRLYRPR